MTHTCPKCGKPGVVMKVYEMNELVASRYSCQSCGYWEWRMLDKVVTKAHTEAAGCARPGGDRIHDPSAGYSEVRAV